MTKIIRLITAIAFTVLLSSGWACQRKVVEETPPSVEETMPSDETTIPEPQDDGMMDEGGES
ncbi:MAG: hypothetical protein HY609_04845 [Deltaproteobacteria bacterium]|nr:hypothetical protein [Deltaproteobacteria bacterium]